MWIWKHAVWIWKISLILYIIGDSFTDHCHSVLKFDCWDNWLLNYTPFIWWVLNMYAPIASTFLSQCPTVLGIFMLIKSHNGVHIHLLSQYFAASVINNLSSTVRLFQCPSLYLKQCKYCIFILARHLAYVCYI